MARIKIKSPKPGEKLKDTPVKITIILPTKPKQKRYT